MSQSVNFGFPMQAKCEFRLRGRKYRIGPSGVRVLRLLEELYLLQTKRNDVAWLLPYRNQIKQLWQTMGGRAALCLVAERTSDPTLRILAIWLRGHCGGNLGVSSIARHWDDPDVATRKEVARALKRLECWSRLRRMAELDPDARIRRLATAGPSRPFEIRLAKFTDHARRIDTAKSVRPLIVCSSLDVGNGRPPKPAWLIRAILQRIHGLVGSRLR